MPPSQALDSSSVSDPKPIARANLKAKLLSSLGNRYAILDTLFVHEYQDDRIFISFHQDSDTFFTLKYSYQVFEPPEPDKFDEIEWEAWVQRPRNDSVYWRLCDEKGNTFAAPKSKPSSNSADRISPEADDGDVFVPLGWVVERHQGSGFHRVTRYACCINLSTDPVSLWFVYDYCLPDEMRISNVEETGDKGPDPRTCYNDPDWNHSLEGSSCPATLYEADRCMTKSSSLDQTMPGYLEQPHKWDIACVYQDAVNDWPSHQEQAQKNPGMELFPLVGPGPHALKLKELPQQLAGRFAK